MEKFVESVFLLVGVDFKEDVSDVLVEVVGECFFASGM